MVNVLDDSVICLKYDRPGIDCPHQFQKLDVTAVVAEHFCRVAVDNITFIPMECIGFYGICFVLVFHDNQAVILNRHNITSNIYEIDLWISSL